VDDLTPADPAPAAEPDPDDEDEVEVDTDEDPDPELDPVAEYEKQRAAEADARRQWGDALRALEVFAKLPSPDELFAARYRKFDHLFNPALGGPPSIPPPQGCRNQGRTSTTAARSLRSRFTP
jgi:hypothetical protein